MNIIEHREWLHRNAELSFCEYNTSTYIKEQLDKLGIQNRTIAGTGVLAVIGEESGRAVLLRADIDALPIEELSDVSYASENRGVMHACGHDMHTASLLGALSALHKNPPQGTTILGLFQPGEEVAPGGALKVLAEKPFESYDIVAAIGIHASPELPTGTVGIREGEFMASTDEVHINIEGKGGHAARPASLRNPVWAAVELLSELHAITPSTDTEHLLAFGKIEAKGASNVIPDRVAILGTFRAFSREWRKECIATMERLAENIGTKHNVKIVVETRGGYPSVINDPSLAAKAREILGAEFGSDSVIDIAKRLTGEDFGRYGELYPSLFLRFGVTERGVEPTELHTANFRGDNSALHYGAKIYELLGRNIIYLVNKG